MNELYQGSRFKKLKMNLFLIFIVSAMLRNLTAVGQSKVLYKTTDTGLEIICKGSTRFAGGKPLLQGKSMSLSAVSEKSGTFTFGFIETADLKTILTPEKDNIWGIKLSLSDGDKHDGKLFAGFFFDEIPGFKTGMEIWRYKPWNSWTKPIRVNSPEELHDWDVQFFYWQYDDGLYGAAIPLSENGFRTTLGAENGKFGCKAYTYTTEASSTEIPMMVIGFGDDPYKLFENIYSAGLKMMGKAENLRAQKVYPEPFEYIGWCTWNSSEMGKYLDEAHLLAGTETFTKQNFPLGWLLIDDGWFDHDGNRLNVFTPNQAKFPNGFKSLTSKLKNDLGLKNVGIWHAYNGYWNGINPDSELGIRYKSELFNWVQNERVDVPSKEISYSFIKPESDSLKAFYEHWHKYMVNEGFSFVKVDNQLVTERMCVNTYPVWTLAEKMHEALYSSTFKYFDGAIINCMNMTNDAFYNFGKSAVARAVEDYFPEHDGGTGYRLEKGGAAAHVLMALYNSLYFSQMVYPDFDMFESYNSYGSFHAAARAISGGPVYVTDLPGKQKFDVLWPLIDNSGRIIRADQPALLTEDCLFQLQDKKPLKAFSFSGKTGLMAVFNAADSDRVEGSISPVDINGLEGESFAVYEFYSQELKVMKKNQSENISLERMDNRYFNFVPVNKGVALIGLVNKYNAPATIVNSKIEKKKVEVTLREGGTFKALFPKKPVSITVNNIPFDQFSFADGLFTAEISSGTKTEVVVKFSF